MLFNPHLPWERDGLEGPTQRCFCYDIFSKTYPQGPFGDKSFWGGSKWPSSLGVTLVSPLLPDTRREPLSWDSSGQMTGPVEKEL